MAAATTTATAPASQMRPLSYYRARGEVNLIIPLTRHRNQAPYFVNRVHLAPSCPYPLLNSPKKKAGCRSITLHRRIAAHGATAFVIETLRTIASPDALNKAEAQR
jgi:hypothetical protein